MYEGLMAFGDSARLSLGNTTLCNDDLIALITGGTALPASSTIGHF